MSLTAWLRRRRLEALREQLAVVRAEIAVENKSERQSGIFYPSRRALNARELARIEYRIAALSAFEGKQ